MHDAITDVAGIRVGHYTNRRAGTGCTVVLCEEGAVAGIDIRGAAPGTRESDVARPGNLVPHVHAIMLTGGSAFGLDAAAGVMSYLAERGRGFRIANGVVVPIVPAAVLFDLSVGERQYPNAADARAACEAATTGSVEQGSCGAGTGATVGKLFGPSYAMKGGLGSASEQLPNGAVVAAMAAVNAVGDVVDPGTGAIVAGAWRAPQGFVNSVQQARRGIGAGSVGLPGTLGNTTLAVVATNAPLNKEQATRLAAMAQNGLVLAVRPANTMFDGDVVFALATGDGPETDLNVLGMVATDVLARAIVRAVLEADGLFGIPAARDLVHAGPLHF